MMARSGDQRRSQEVDRQLTVRQELQGDNVDQALKTVDRLGNANDLCRLGNRFVVVVANNHWNQYKNIQRRLTRSTLSSSNLSQSRGDLGVKRVSSHDEDDTWKSEEIPNENGILRKVLIDQSEGSVLQFSCKDTLTVHVRNLLDLESSLETGGIWSQLNPFETTHIDILDP